MLISGFECSKLLLFNEITFNYIMLVIKVEPYHLILENCYSKLPLRINVIDE